MPRAEGTTITPNINTVIAYTDGGCFGNPGPGAWAYLLKWPDGKEDTGSGGDLKTTNNREELKAIREALKSFHEKVGDSREWRVVVRSDSEYAIKTLKGTYKRKANLDLFPEIDRLKDSRVSFAYVQGHASDKGNNRVHDLVQAEISKLRKTGKVTAKTASSQSDVRRVIRKLRAGDDDLILAAAKLFDHPPQLADTKRFLSSEGHHMLIAYVSDDPAGFVTGVEMTHPDKGTEMFLYELAVDEPYHRQGIGKALVKKLAGVARERKCYGMWVLTEDDNVAALATYRAAGGDSEPGIVMFDWLFEESMPK